jgi:hypothetical protein
MDTHELVTNIVGVATTGRLYGLPKDFNNTGIHGFTNHINMMQNRDRWKTGFTKLT